MKTTTALARAIILGVGLLAAKAFADYYGDSASNPGTHYASGTVYGVPSGATVEWVSSGWTQIGLSGGGLNVFESGQYVEGAVQTTQSDDISYTLYAYVDGYNWIALHMSW